VFFHRKDVLTGTFNELAVDDQVALELVEDALTGPRAVRVAREPKRSTAA
jgi:cold shock CspA family protein